MENEDEFVLKCLEILSDGRSSLRTINRKTVVSEANESVLWRGLSRRGRTNRKLNFTDLKVVDPAFRRGATLRLLSNVIILSVFDLKALVFHEKAQIFDPENPQSAQVSKQLITSLRSTAKSSDGFIFELFVLDTLLTLVSKQATEPFESLEFTTHQMLKEAPRKNVAQYLSSLRLKKEQLYQIAENSEIPRQLLVSFLEEEAFKVYPDFASNNLEQQTEDLVEQRLVLFRCLDSSILLLETIGQRVHRLLEEVNNREDVLSIGMDSFRNRVISYDLVFTLISSAISFTSLFGACFGTNILTPLELSSTGSPIGWYSVVGGSLLFSFLFSIVLLYFFKGSFKYIRKQRHDVNRCH
ncbi:hypothetical protein GpartN1_g3444.t1 [Galdieria partita]|uniref:Magnesium transporter n=1 Tax=Galdieria partita TaxID=83374 RepID=A0A9C7PVJ6_9RHOD|nr:hypothetical protein GpartN1_g3444.t1 [Galdieria partita]